MRYVLREGGKTMASAPIEIAEGEVTVSAPETATTGAKFPVSWTGTVNGNDYITIVPQGTEEGEFGNYFVVRDKTENALQAPGRNRPLRSALCPARGRQDTGQHADRNRRARGHGNRPGNRAGRLCSPGFLDGHGFDRRLHGHRAGRPLDEGEFGNYITVRDKTEGGSARAGGDGALRGALHPARGVQDAGHRDDRGRRARGHRIRPRPGARKPTSCALGWTGTVDPGDYVALAPMGSGDDDFSNYFTVRDKAEHDMTAPPTAGLYELRYILREGGRVLARKPVEVLAEDAALNTGAALNAPEMAAAGSKIEVSWESDSGQRRPAHNGGSARPGDLYLDRGGQDRRRPAGRDHLAG